MTDNPTQSVPPPSTSFLDDSFARLRSSGYQRDTDGRWFGGVCTGLAQRFGVDPVLIRATAVVLAFLGGIGLTAYVVLWLLLPDRRGDILAERAVRQGDAGPIVLLVLAAFLVIGGLFSIGNGNGWYAPLWLIPVAVLAWFVVSRRNTGAPQTGYGSPTAPAPYFPPPPPYGTAPQQVPYGTTPPPAPYGATPLPSGEAMSAQPTMFPATPMASAPPQAPPPAPYAGAQPGGYRGPQPGTYGGPPATGPYGGQPTPPVPPRPIAPPPPPRPRRRRPSAFVGLVSLGIALVGIGLGAALDDPLGFPGSSATLGFLIALAGVSVVVLTLGIKGRASGFSGFLVVLLGLLLVTASAASRVEVQDGVGERTWTPVPSSGVTTFELGAGEATLDLSRLDSTPPSTTASGVPQKITVEIGAGDLTILVPAGLDARVDANVAFGDITHRGGVGGTTEASGSDRSISTVIGDQPVQVVVDAQLGLGQITIQEQ